MSPKMVLRTETLESPQETRSSIRRRPQRSIHDILQRRERRLRQRREIMPPGVLHGAVRLDAIYATTSAAWVDQAVFVERVLDVDGELVAVTVAAMVEGFLTLKQAVAGEVEDLDAWLGAEVESARSVVEVHVGREGVLVPELAELEERAGHIRICCRRERLWELERATLAVTRDYDFPAQVTALETEAMLLDSRTNLLSVIGLCAAL